MSRPTAAFLLYLLGRRRPFSTVTEREAALLVAFSTGRTSVAEIGVFEGVTSARIAEVLDPDGVLLLVDPYQNRTRPERLLGVSYSRHIARRVLRPWRARLRWIESTSATALRDLDPAMRLEFVFIDADHAYEAVREDFLGWRERLAPGGVIALHDSGICAARRDLDSSVGPVRLAAEIRRGDFGPWRCIAERDSVTAFCRLAPIE